MSGQFPSGRPFLSTWATGPSPSTEVGQSFQLCCLNLGRSQCQVALFYSCTCIVITRLSINNGDRCCRQLLLLLDPHPEWKPGLPWIPAENDTVCNLRECPHRLLLMRYARHSLPRHTDTVIVWRRVGTESSTESENRTGEQEEGCRFCSVWWNIHQTEQGRVGKSCRGDGDESTGEPAS